MSRRRSYSRSRSPVRPRDRGRRDDGAGDRRRSRDGRGGRSERRDRERYGGDRAERSDRRRERDARPSGAHGESRGSGGPPGMMHRGGRDEPPARRGGSGGEGASLSALIRGADDGGGDAGWGGDDARKQEEGEGSDGEPLPPAEKPNFGLSGALARDERHGNMYRGVLLKWSEPADACMPKRRWRLYVFKNDKMLGKPLHLHRQSAYLVGRHKEIADILTEHASCSKQHAVLQFRLVALKSKNSKLAVGEKAKRVVKPYVMDLQSSNGTFLNGKRIEDSRYYELRARDQLKFGASTREYILLHDDLVKS